MTRPGTGAPMDELWTGRSQSAAQTRALGAAVAQQARQGDLIALVGELGVGKTQWVRGLAVGLGAPDAAVASPTFVMMHEYPTRADRPTLVHIDAYRLHSLEDLESIGWDSATGGSELRQRAIVVIEWADRIGELPDGSLLQVELSHAGEHEREVRIAIGPGWRDRANALRAALDAAGSSANDAAMENSNGNSSRSSRSKQAQRPCPICSTFVNADSETYPFCSKRCRTIDLGMWAKEEYRVTRPLEEKDLEDGE